MEGTIMQHWVVAYDIPDDQRRAKLANLLDAFGDRIQWSVFEISVSNDDLDILCRRTKKIIDPELDAVRLYPLCDDCAPKIRDLGRIVKLPFDEPDLIIV